MDGRFDNFYNIVSSKLLLCLRHTYTDTHRPTQAHTHIHSQASLVT